MNWPFRVASFSVSLDGFGAGPSQDIENPLGVGGTELHQWVFPTRTFQRIVLGADGGTTGMDDDFAARGFENVGAWILGRNMFGPVRGAEFVASEKATHVVLRRRGA
jgi:dihydrofolate reductase